MTIDLITTQLRYTNVRIQSDNITTYTGAFAGYRKYYSCYCVSLEFITHALKFEHYL